MTWYRLRTQKMRVINYTGLEILIRFFAFSETTFICEYWCLSSTFTPWRSLHSPTSSLTCNPCGYDYDITFGGKWETAGIESWELRLSETGQQSLGYAIVSFGSSILLLSSLMLPSLIRFRLRRPTTKTAALPPPGRRQLYAWRIFLFASFLSFLWQKSVSCCWDVN